MKILIVSDSHEKRRILLQLKKQFADETVAMFHCGDSELASDDQALDQFVYVKGNCDHDPNFSNEVVKDIGGHRFFATHGHLYNVNRTLQNLAYKAQETEANIVLFGHTHRAGSEMIDGILYINSGSISYPRGRKERTYVILDLHDQKVDVNFYDHEGKYLDYLSATYQFG
ncbi:MAG: metallophosphoesterase [Bacillus sp. (in: firmicutes)]